MILSSAKPSRRQRAPKGTGKTQVLTDTVRIAGNVFTCEYRQGNQGFAVVSLGDRDCGGHGSRRRSLQAAAEAAFHCIPDGTRLVALNPDASTHASKWTYFHVTKGIQ